MPGKKLPIVIALVQLPEGVRMIGELLGAGPGQVRIGLPVHAEFVRVDDDLTLPAWRALPPRATTPGDPRQGAAADLAAAGHRRHADVRGRLALSPRATSRTCTTTGTARSPEVRKDIFLNILTTTGLVQRYVAAWAGPDAIFRAISIRLGVPCHAGDTLTLTGKVTAVTGPSG